MEHEAIEELLAGYALRSLSGEDAREADRLLTEHVPTCAICRDALTGFQELAGELALDVPAAPPPETLLVRLHRDLEAPARRLGPRTLVAAAASFALVVGLGGFALTQGMRANRLAQQRATLAEFADFSNRPDANRVAVGPMTEVARPGIEQFYIYGQGIPAPPPGSVYSLWLASGERYLHVTDFRPADGAVILPIAFDPTEFDRVVISVEREGAAASRPSGRSWSSAA